MPPPTKPKPLLELQRTVLRVINDVGSDPTRKPIVKALDKVLDAIHDTKHSEEKEPLSGEKTAFEEKPPRSARSKHKPS